MPSISIIGDSQAGGLTQMGGLGAALRAKRWETRRFFYRNGASTRRLIDDLPEILQGPRADAVLVVAGGNDNTGARSDWQTMVVQLRSAGVQRIFWLGPPAAPNDPSLDAEREAVSRLQQMQFSSQPYVTWISGRATAQGLPRRDEVHLTAQGYEQWARRVSSFIDSSSGQGLVTIALAGGALWLAWQGAQRMSR